MSRILIVDDNLAIRSLMKFYLEQAGYIVCSEANDGVQALQCVLQMQPDLILLDFTMPIMSGIETAAALKRIAPDIPIILFTLHEDSINKELATTMGVDLVLDKMCGIPKLGESVKTVLAWRSQASRSRAPRAGRTSTPADVIPFISD